MGFTPGYEKGFNDPNEKEVFLCWKGANPDEFSLLGRLTFGGPLAVNSYHKLSTSWGQLKASSTAHQVRPGPRKALLGFGLFTRQISPEPTDSRNGTKALHSLF